MTMRIVSEQVVLASASPRRLDILQSLGLYPQVVATDVEEISQGRPRHIVIANAEAKAEAAATLLQGSDKLIIAADTIVVKEGRVLGKPQDEADAAAMLSFLSGSAHEVYSSIALIDLSSGCRLSDCSLTQVFFRPLSAADIATYIATKEPMDKAGAYGIQGLGSVFIEKIAGDHGTVVGLSTFLLARMLDALGKKIF